MPNYGRADPGNPKPYSKRSKRRQRMNKRGHPRSKGDKPRPFDKGAYAAGHDAVKWGTVDWEARRREIEERG